MADHLDRMRVYPDIAGRALRLEYTSVSLSPQAKLFGRRSLLEQSDPGRAADRPVFAAFEEELTCPWALYHVRRILPASKADPHAGGRPLRSVERVPVGRASALGRRLRTFSERHGYPVEVDERYGRVRTWMRRRQSELLEEQLVTAPFHVESKQVQRFKREWGRTRGGVSAGELTPSHQERHIDYTKVAVKAVGGGRHPLARVSPQGGNPGRTSRRPPSPTRLAHRRVSAGGPRGAGPQYRAVARTGECNV
ncbi:MULTISPECIES: hypothetical protein [unclassified Streptomyces]|uniref:hypothetical protein n=1 Tax=unclassified Streptomyces TaxID=2593676 RepID=UPI00380264A2